MWGRGWGRGEEETMWEVIGEIETAEEEWKRSLCRIWRFELLSRGYEIHKYKNTILEQCACAVQYLGSMHYYITVAEIGTVEQTIAENIIEFKFG